MRASSLRSSADPENADELDYRRAFCKKVPSLLVDRDSGTDRESEGLEGDSVIVAPWSGAVLRPMRRPRPRAIRQDPGTSMPRRVGFIRR